MTENDDLPLTHGDAARFIGVSVPTFKKLLNSADGRDLVPTKIGARNRFRPSVLRAHLDSHTRREPGDE
jgi:hypothetical protein